MNVLIVEDYKPDAFVIAAMLRKVATRIEIASNLKEAYKWIRKKNGFDVVMLDLGLPDSDRDSTLQAVKEIKGSGRKVVIMSGQSIEDITCENGHYGADACFSKNDPDFLQSLKAQLA